MKDKIVDSGSSYDALKTMELVQEIYYADPDWRQKYEIEKTLGCLNMNTVDRFFTNDPKAFADLTL